MGMGRMGVNKEQLVDKNKWLPKTSLPCNLLLFLFYKTDAKTIYMFFPSGGRFQRNRS